MAYTIDLPAGTDGTVVVSSRLADGAVTGVDCGAYSTPAVALRAAANTVLKFCATLPVSGAAPDTVGWIDRQLSPAAVGYSAVLDHNGIRYALSYSQYDTNRTHYEIAVRPR